MKIGVVTITDYSNFGNRLQAYAVCKALRRRLGCDVVSLEKPYREATLLSRVKESVAMMLCVFPALAEKCFGSNITRANNFRTWGRRHIPTRDFDRHQPLPDRLNDEFDLFLAGSDQIWNYDFSAGVFADYFLTFAEKGKRAAISASFGVEQIPEEWRKTYAQGLLGFRHISVREDAGAKIVKDLTGRDVPVLIDPVMLLSREEWLTVAKKPRVDTSKPYVLKYFLGDEAEDERIEHWAKEQGYEIYELMNDQIPELYSAGPGEFLTLIDNAALVCSDSFHCIAFSILFRRPFAVYERRGSGNYMTSRLDTLLRKFGFEDRWKHGLAPQQYLNCDFSQVDSVLDAERQKALAYLQEILRETEHPGS